MVEYRNQGLKISYSGEKFQAASWTGSMRVGMDLIRDDFGNIHTLKEFAQNRHVLGEQFDISVFLTESFRFTTKNLTGPRINIKYVTYCMLDIIVLAFRLALTLIPDKLSVIELEKNHR